MSNIYIQEPPSNGKVLLKTSAGDIDIELWSKEAPKACRNFVQLCMEGYYDGTMFHRVVREFIVQGGDPTGTGTGGESIYGRPFKDEFHSRLRFNRRGLVAMANAGPHDNGSQFFFTLGRADELNNKHTVFGKVTGDTVYNMLRLAEVECDDDERPLNPHKIKIAEVLHSPFEDIIPRETRKAKKEKDKEEGKKSQSKATKNFSLLSFGEEAEEEEEMVNQVSQTLKGKSKSSHDLLKDDPRLSSVPAVDKKKKKRTPGDAAEADDVADGDVEDDTDSDEEYDSEEREKMRELISNKLKKEKAAEKATDEDERGKKPSRSDELRKEARQLKKDLQAIKQRKEDSLKPAVEEVKEGWPMFCSLMSKPEKSRMPPCRTRTLLRSTTHVTPSIRGGERRARRS
ncbi:spliceosome-associated protein CWC27 homolog isoform X2 [Cottoperca gobio]|uniref:Spliceosome-associated protein CWC27 homolog n=1 Tax=Cottoperca gobio TaxID=56716 RepID=A0A6J2QRL8_COTGO|nr:spliceosome-associated protein CWC27 homolog isoform X2 [Cottoperca gobio]